MKKRIWHWVAVYAFALGVFLMIGIWGSHAVTVLTEHAPIENRVTVVIDAGHGAPDGGSVSCTGVLESQINLEIAMRLDGLMKLLGIQTKMIRTTDHSVYTQGDTIAAKKVSDLKERVRVVNGTEHAVLVSIHQNYFSDGRYRGPQVFYADTAESKNLAGHMQNTLNTVLGKNSSRHIKKSSGIYLLEHISCPGILIECGFLSNPKEEALLRNPAYQKKFCCILASACSTWLQSLQTA